MQTLKTAGQRESCARVEDTYWPHSCIRSGYLALVTVSKKANSAVYGFFMASAEKIIEEHLGQALQILTPKLRQFCTTALNRISYLAWCWLRNQIKGFSGSLTLPYIHGQTCPNPPHRASVSAPLKEVKEYKNCMRRQQRVMGWCCVRLLLSHADSLELHQNTHAESLSLSFP